MTHSIEAAERTSTAVLEMGRAWMLSPTTLARGAELGMTQQFSFWVNGRAGVLGDVDADVAAAAIAFMSGRRVRELWEARPANLSPRKCTEAYAAAAEEWSAEAFADQPTADLQRLTELIATVALQADPSIGVLFAGWRRMTLPSSPHGAAAVAINVVREMRGGAHISAVHAVGLGPHGAIISTDHPVRGGAPGAERFGWLAPHPAANPERRQNAEQLTTLICSHAFDVLSESERGEYVDLMLQIHRFSC